MANPPNKQIMDAFLADTIDAHYRVELYESDGTTSFKPEIWSEILVNGSVTADQTRDERRALDLTLNNNTGDLDPVAGNFWYDKVIKVFYGIETHLEDRPPRAIIVEEFNSIGQALKLKYLLSAAGIFTVDYNPQVEFLSEVEDYDVLISITSNYTRKLALLTSAIEHGQSVLTFGIDATAVQLPYIIAGAATSTVAGDGNRTYEKLTVADPVTTGWASWAVKPDAAYRKIIALADGVVALANSNDGANGVSPGVLMRQSLGGASWIHVSQNNFGSDKFVTDTDAINFGNFLASALTKLDYYSPPPIWEVQIGEFIPDSIGDASDDFGGLISVAARDYTSRCINSKLTKATTFKATQLITEIVSVLAANAGVTKKKLPTLNTTLGKDTTYERDQSRWEIMKEVALANNYELYFDAEGYLRMEKQKDPVSTPASFKLAGGERGNLISRGRKTSNERIFNVVTVVGESSDTTKPLVYGEARNENPASPSRVAKLGERTNNISSPLVTTGLQAQQLAESMLAVSSLEEFELSFSAVLFPWLEPGEIIEMGEVGDSSWGPARYLLSSFTLPLDLSPMSGSGKRVTIV